MSWKKILGSLVVLIVVTQGMKIFGLTVSDLFEFAQTNTRNAVTDTKALMSGEYQERLAKSMKAEAGRVEVTAMPSGDDAGLSRELAEARRQMLEERSKALEQKGNQLLKGDVESLKQQVRNNARQSGGND